MNISLLPIRSCGRLSTLLLVAGLAPVVKGAESPSAEQLAFFETKIRPVLVENCYGCHSADAQAQGKLKAGLFADSREGLLTGGETGPALVAGKPGESLLLKVLNHEIKGAEMPPKGKLPAETIADLARWIEMGAPDPRLASVPIAKARHTIDVEAGRDWWAFQPLRRPDAPVVKREDWIRTPVDAFILARQEAAGITPSDPAEREVLLRRATFALTGLPPTPEEREAFLKDASPDAYPRLIDRLLDSDRYGERWGRHWLDVVRYAESGGYEFDGFRPGAFHYRDWVIRALNDDLPYDEFIRMQLAGDKLMPGEYAGASAAGFLVAGPYPGQITAKTVEKIRYDQIDDMVSTIGSGFLGLTMACVRCHDHKYDPLPQRDYYGIAAALATTVHSPAKIDLSFAETQKKLAVHNEAGAPLIAALRNFEKTELPRRLDEWRRTELPKLATSAPWQILDIRHASAQKASLTSDLDGHVIYQGGKEKDDTYTIKAVTYQQGLRAFRLDALADPSLPSKGPGLSDNGNFVLADVKITARPLDPADKSKPVALKLKPVKASFEQANYPLEKAFDNNGGSGWAVAPEMGKDHAAQFAIDGGTVGFPGGTELEFKLQFSGHFGLGKMRLAFASGAADPGLTDSAEHQGARELAAFLATQPDEKAVASNPGLVRWFSRHDARARELVGAVAAHERGRPQPVLTEVYTTKDGGQDVYFLRRGEVDRKEGKASPSFLQVLMPGGDAPERRWVPEPSPQRPAVHPRIALADWMTDTEAGGGPLLARVIVNRIWRQHFGRGLVPTTNDFGTQGEKPTHPELLDWLAADLVENGWKLKRMHRIILLSSTWMQGNRVRPETVQADPENRLWAQRPARRLEAEAIRDALLQVGGRLDLTMHGPSEANYESGRRSVYLRVKRSELIPFLTMFDAPEPNQSIGDRGNTTLPTQALAVMNSGFVRDLAARLEARIAATKPAGVEEAIARGYEMALARSPRPGETEIMKAYIAEQTAMLGGRPDAPTQAMREFCLALLSLNEFIFVD
ncbi:MAG: PSD1 domain-containing protein [Verrucomicrobiales bacterium]|nr:PSD1 domain-containing protein [Verrucomicrobiales bacterium]